MAGAKRVLLWRFERGNGRGFAIAAAGGPRPTAQSGSADPLAWTAREGISARIDPAPVWSDAQQVFAVPVRSLDQEHLVATFEIDEATPLPATQFDGLGVYLGSMMSVEAGRSALGEQHARADELIRTLRALPDATDAETLSQQIAQTAYDLVGASGCVVTTWERNEGTVVASQGDAPVVGASFSVGESETALAARAGTTLTRAHGRLGQLPMVAPNERIAKRPNSLVAVPLKIRGEVIGVVTAWSRGDISQHRMSDLETLAPYAALQLHHAREFGVMRELAQHDALTGMNNRLAFERFLADESARYERYQRPFALIMIDIDHFKDVNDRYGHEAGDFVLQQIGKTIADSLRAVDFAARLGGEEFVMLLPETDLQKAVEIAERIRQRVETLDLDWRGQRIVVRVSGGVSAIPESVPSPSQLVSRADAALYASKRAGRNRVTADARPE